MTQTGSVTKRLDGNIAVITGGNSGIDLATAQRFVEEGVYVFITGRPPKRTRCSSHKDWQKFHGCSE
jgi:NAD(P)-dependent dehydrogenase (short-subunit alcohol dehydrogenase family)